MMGALEQARIQQKAPWPNATPEEDAAYDQQVHMGNIEFEQGVADQMGVVGREAIDADRAKLLSGNWNVRGFTTPSKLADIDKKKYAPLFRNTKDKLEPNMHYAVGAEQATNSLWAHEFGHTGLNIKERREAVKEISFTESKNAQLLVKIMGEEQIMRLWDAYRADSKEEWQKAVYFWLDRLLSRGTVKRISMIEAEKRLKKTLGLWEDTFINMEVEAAEEKGIRYKTRRKSEGVPDTGSLKQDYTEAMHHRQKRWYLEELKTDIKDSPQQNVVFPFNEIQ